MLAVGEDVVHARCVGGDEAVGVAHLRAAVLQGVPHHAFLARFAVVFHFCAVGQIAQLGLHGLAGGAAE